MCSRLGVFLILSVFLCMGTHNVALFAQPEEAADDVIHLKYATEDVIYATVSMFDANRTFVIDTGSSLTVVDSRFENQLGSQPEGTRRFRTVMGGATLPYYRAPMMKIITGLKEAELAVPVVGVADLKSIQAMLDRSIAGVIGMDFLHSYVLRLNLAENYAALARTLGTPQGDVEVIRFDKIGAPSIRLLITNDQFHEFLLDTGACSGATLRLERTLFETLRKNGGMVIEGASVTASLGGFKDSQRGILAQFGLGDSRLRNVDVSSGSLNLVGLKFLERYEADIDFPNRKAYFRPGKRFRDPVPLNLTHFAVKIHDDQLVVIGCRGIAEDAGIRVGDLLIRINDRPAREMTISEFRRLQCLPDTQLDLTFEREAKSFDVSLSLKRPASPFPDQPVGPQDERPAN